VRAHTENRRILASVPTEQRTIVGHAGLRSTSRFASVVAGLVPATSNGLARWSNHRVAGTAGNAAGMLQIRRNTW
jgi:hypothetical protein